MIARLPIMRWLFAGFVFCLVFAGCKKGDAPSHDKNRDNAQVIPVSAQSVDKGEHPFGRRTAQIKVHDPAHPPIGCPLKGGWQQ